MRLSIKSLDLRRAALSLSTISFQPLVAATDESDWATLKQQAFGDRPISAEDGVVVLDAPYDRRRSPRWCR